MLILNISAKNKFAAQTSNLRIDYLTRTMVTLIKPI